MFLGDTEKNLLLYTQIVATWKANLKSNAEIINVEAVKEKENHY